MTSRLLASTLLAFAISISDVDADCTSDMDCHPNWNCVKLPMFRGSACAPISCAKGALQAMIDGGFEPNKWVNDIRGNTNFRNRDFLRVNDNEALTLQQAYENNAKPPLSTFTANYTACTDPKSGEDTVTEDEEATPEQIYLTYTSNGVQWGASAGLGYTGKSVWYELLGTSSQVIFSCLGALLGAQVGALSYVAQVQSFLFARGDGDEEGEAPKVPPFLSETSGRQASTPSVTCFPITVLGPLGVTLCWLSDGTDISAYNIVEVSIGAQFGASLGGLQACWTEQFLT